LEQVVAQTGKLEPILVDSTLSIRGQNLKGDRLTRVRLGEVETSPTDVSERELILPLTTISPQDLRAGIQSLQVVHAMPTQDPQRPQQGVAVSNAVPITVRPRLETVALEDMAENDDDLYDATVIVAVNVTIGQEQRVVLALNERAADQTTNQALEPANKQPAAYLFDIPRRSQNLDRIMIPIRNVKPGHYLVRVLIDGAESQLTVDTDATSPTFDQYIGPSIAIG
ncbi:MAG: DUF4255 domain-containing protein, partial [Cyanobacteria bacterium P01_H01_bin.121]